MPSNLKLPNGLNAGDMDKVMVLMTWVKHLEEKYKKEAQHKKILFAGMGMPTYPINHAIASHELEYWNGVQSRGAKAREHLSAAKSRKKDETDNAYNKRVAATRDKVVESNSTIPYGNPQGTGGARTTFAKALNKWYPGLQAEAKDILLPVGGSGALYAIFDFINEKKNKQGVIVTPFPYYTLYKGGKQQNKLHSIRVMQEPGYKLTAHALQQSLERARSKQLPINAFLFCDPNNPTGTVVDEAEWVKIAEVLAAFLAAEQAKPAHERTPIILDEAYAEMGLTKKPVSLLVVLLKVAPWLKENVILIRSATKGASAAGERMALAYSSNEYFITECLTPGINVYGHAPISAQESFARGLNELDDDQLEEMALFYGPQLELVHERAYRMAVTMSDVTYKPEGTFYIMLNLHDLIGQDIHPDAKKAVGDKKTIETDEDICYHLMFAEEVMIAPLSYYGLPAESGLVRITCSVGDTQLNTIMDKILAQVIKAREAKKEKLSADLDSIRKLLGNVAYNQSDDDDKSDTHIEAQKTIGKILELVRSSPQTSQAKLIERKEKERRHSNTSTESDGSGKSLTSASSSTGVPPTVEEVDAAVSLLGGSPSSSSGDAIFQERAFKEFQAKSLKAELEEMSQLLSKAQKLLHVLDRPKERKAVLQVQSVARGFSVRTQMRKEAVAAVSNPASNIHQAIAYHKAELARLEALVREPPKTPAKVNAVLGANSASRLTSVWNRQQDASKKDKQKTALPILPVAELKK